jgi:hypothetical protein
LTFGAVAYYAVFQLPFHFPLTHPLVSASYSFGFNNRVAVLATILLIAAAFVYRVIEQKAPASIPFSDHEKTKVSYRLLGGALLIYLIATFAVLLWARSEVWYDLDWETSHFLWRLKLTEVYGLQPYRDYQYEYGPLLAYLPLWWHKALFLLNFSDEFDYYLLHWTLNAVGLCSLAYILNQFSMPPSRRNAAFIVLAAAGFLPYMGLSGLLLRFTAPLFGLALIYRTASGLGKLLALRVFLATLSAAALTIGLSAEIGVSFLIAAGVYGAFLLPARSGIAVLCAVASAVCLSFALLPYSYYTSLFHFSEGANNLPLLPTSPHLVFYLAALLWFAPKWLAGGWKQDGLRAPVLAAGCLSIVLIPGALGRCDPPHVLTYGITPAILMFASAANTKRIAFGATLALYAAVFVFGFQAINAWVFHVTPRSILAHIRNAQIASPDLKSLERYPQLASPYGTSGSSKSLQRWLWSRGKIAPEYYLGGMGIYTPAQITDRLRDLSRFRYAIADSNMLEMSGEAGICAGAQPYIRQALLHPQRFALPCKHEMRDPWVEIARFLQRSYRVVEKNDSYVVWEQLHPE